MIKSLLTNNALMAFVAFTIGFLALLFSCLVGNFGWFSRSGSLVVGIGIVILSRTFITGEDLRPHITSAETGMNKFSKEHYAILGEQIPEYVEEDYRNRFALGLLGPLVSFAGTIVWGFGDLLNCLHKGFCCC